VNLKLTQSSQERRGILKLAVMLNFKQLPQFSDIVKKTIHGIAVYLKLTGQAKKEGATVNMLLLKNYFTAASSFLA